MCTLSVYRSNNVNKIKHYREKIGFTQAQLAEACGLTKAAICNYEQSIRQPRIAHLMKIIKCFNINGVHCGLNDIYPPEEYKQAS